MRKFVAFYEGELMSPITFDSPRAAAESIASRPAQVQRIAADGTRYIDELLSLTASAIVCEVRAATLSDFFDPSDLLTSLRGWMLHKIGNDDALSSVDEALVNDIVTRVDDVLNSIAEAHGIRIDGLIVVKKWLVRRERISDFDFDQA